MYIYIVFPAWLRLETSANKRDFYTDNGFGLSNVEIPTPDKMRMIFHRSADRGLGTVNIANDFFIGTAVSNALGFNQVTIKMGTYPIDYSNFPAFGETTFDIITQ